MQNNNEEGLDVVIDSLNQMENAIQDVESDSGRANMEKPTQPSAEEHTSLFVGNISYEMKTSDLIDLFTKIGPVKHANVLSDTHTGRSKGCGVVEFENAADAKRAIAELNETEQMSRRIFIRFDEYTKEGSRPQRRPDDRYARDSYRRRDVGGRDRDPYDRRPSRRDDSYDRYRRRSPSPRGRYSRRSPSPYAARGRSRRSPSPRGRYDRSPPPRRYRSPSPYRGRYDRTPSPRGRRRSLTPPPRRGDHRLRSRSRERPPPMRDYLNQLYVGNLAWAVKWPDLQDFFNSKGVGKVLRADVMIGDDGRSRGFGLVAFETAAECQAAIKEFNGAELKGRSIEVREDKGSGYRSGAGREMPQGDVKTDSAW